MTTVVAGAGTVLVVLEYETQPAKTAASMHPKDRHFIMRPSPDWRTWVDAPSDPQ